MDKNLDNFSPKIADNQLKAAEFFAEKLKRDLLVFASCVGITTAIVFGFLHLRAGNSLIGLIELCLALVALLNLTIIIPAGYLSAASSVVLSIMFLLLPYLLLTGGFEKTGWMWYFTFLPLAFSLKKLRSGVIWVIATMIILFVMMALQYFGLLIGFYSTTEIRQLLIAYSVVFSLFLWRERLSQKYQSILLDINKQNFHLNALLGQQTQNNEEINKKMANQNDLLAQSQKAVMNILSDIEKEKEKSELLAIDLKKYQMALESASDHIIITDAEGIVIYANKGVEKITGFKREEVLGQKAGIPKLWGGLMPREFYLKLWQKIKIDKQTFIGELTNKRKTGEHYIALASISPVLDNAGQVVFFVGIERDITKEKEVDRMKTEVVSLVTHQLKTPITAIKWTLENLRDGDVGELTQAQLTVLNDAIASNNHMSELVEVLLNISRIESSRIIIEPKPTQIKELVNSLITELQPQFNEKHISLNLTCDIAEPINIDPKLTYEVYKNLLTNAIKYSRPDSQVEISITKTEERIISKVIDKGFGIPKIDQPNIFQKFFRASNITKTIPDGTGLGLYLIKMIVETSGGKIGFESQENVGTTFWFSLPSTGMVTKKGEVSLG